MNTKPFPALCRDCKHSVSTSDGTRWLKCTHPVVNANDAWALSDNNYRGGSDCRMERERSTWLFAKCGRQGKLWEPKT